MNMSRWITTSSALLALGFSLVVQAAVITVDSNSDGTVSSTLCQLRDAIEAANSNLAVDGCNAGNGADIIQFSLANTSILLEADLPPIEESLQINGPGRDQLIIDGDDSYRPIVSTPNVASVAIRNLTFFQGYSDGYGGCMSLAFLDSLLLEDIKVESCESDLAAGGIATNGLAAGNSTTFRRVMIIANRAVQGAGGASIGGGSVVIEDSVFASNSVSGVNAGGGGLSVGSGTELQIKRSTFWNNSSLRSSSAIDIFSASAQVRIEHSTIFQNPITGVGMFDEGGAIVTYGQVTLFNTIVADNPESNPEKDTGDISLISAGSVITEGFNFIGDHTGVAGVFPAGVNANGDQVGNNASPLDPDLGTLQDNGGPTLSAMPNPASPVVDKGSCPGEVVDQRGYQNLQTGLRPVDVGGIANADDGCDTGAVEYQAALQLIFADGFEDGSG